MKRKKLLVVEFHTRCNIINNAFFIYLSRTSLSIKWCIIKMTIEEGARTRYCLKAFLPLCVSINKYIKLKKEGVCFYFVYRDKK
jgi:hypothetical protein